MNIFNFLTPKSETYYLSYDCTIRQALEKFDYHKFSVVPLLDDEGHYVGTLSEGDLLRYIKDNCNFDVSLAEQITVDKIDKYRSYQYLTSLSSMEEIYRLGLEQNFVPIVDDRMMYIGIMKRKSLLKYLFEKTKTK